MASRHDHHRHRLRRHHVRTELTLIKGHCGILLRRQAQGLPVDPADLTRRLEAISGAADRTVVAFESEEHPGDDDPHPS